MSKKKKKEPTLEEIQQPFELDADMRQRRAHAFAVAYVKELALNRTKNEALKAAFGVIGLYGNTRQAEQWLKDPLVIQEVKNLVEKAAKKYQKDVDDVLSEITLIAYSDIANYLDRDPIDPEGTSRHDGLKLKHIHDLGVERRAIKTIKHKHRIIRHKGSDEIEEINEYEYEVWDKMTALRILSEFHKIINAPKSDEEGKGDTHVHVWLPDNGFGGGAPVPRRAVEAQVLPTLPEPPKNNLEGATDLSYEEI